MCASCEKLRAELAPHRLRAAYRLTPQESVIILAMYRNAGVMSARQLDACSPPVGARRKLKTMDFVIWSIRSKLGRETIQTITNSGWALTPQGREKVAEVVG